MRESICFFYAEDRGTHGAIRNALFVKRRAQHEHALSATQRWHLHTGSCGKLAFNQLWNSWRPFAMYLENSAGFNSISSSKSSWLK